MSGKHELKRKIASVRSTAKLTKAMRMVAASKMNKAVVRAMTSRAYAENAWKLVRSVSRGRAVTHPFFLNQAEGRTALVVLTSNRGLAGSFNSQVIREALRNLDAQTDLFLVGRKGQTYFRRLQDVKIIAAFDMPDRLPKFEDVTPMTHVLLQQFSSTYRRIVVVYNRFDSLLKQTPEALQLLPIALNPQDEEPTKEYRFEPSPDEVLRALLNRVVPMRLYQLLLESSASEHSARMVAMKNATDNANELVDDLTLTYQSVRQSEITRQIIEVASGAAALRA